MTASGIPNEIMLSIFSYCGWRDLASLSNVCRAWHSMAHRVFAERVVPLADIPTQPVLLHVFLRQQGHLQEEIDLTQLRHNDHTLKEIVENCPALKSLRLAPHYLLKGEAVEKIATAFPKLWQLDIPYAQGVARHHLLRSIDTLTMLRSLDLSGWDVREEEACHLLQRSPPLMRLALDDCQQVGDRVCETYAMLVVKPKRIRLGSTSITESGVLTLVRHADDTLAELGLRKAPITPFICKEIASHCFYLHCLDVSGCGDLDDGALQTVLRANCVLYILNVRGCSRLTNAAFKGCSLLCPHLQHLDARDCPKMTSYVIDHLPRPIILKL